jgi:hypothetical protein
MNKKQIDRCVKLIGVMDDARRRQVHAHYEAMKYGAGSISGDRRYITYENQIDRYAKAAAELAKLILEVAA